VSITYEEFMDRLSKSDSRISMNIRSVLLKQSLKMEADAKRNATHFPRVQTGRLRNSISGNVINFQNEDYLVLRAGGISTPSRPFTESADVVYAAIQEYGGTIEMKGGSRFIKEKRYLRNAFDKHRDRTKSLIDKAIIASLKGKDL